MSKLKLTAADILNTRRLPARIDAKVTSVLLGVPEHDIPILVQKRILEPLGSPADNAIKWFSSQSVLEVAGDLDQLNKLTNLLYRTRRKNNETQRKKTHGSQASGEAPPVAVGG